MNLEQLRAKLLAITSQLEVLNQADQFNDDELAQIEELHAEFATVSQQISAKEKIEAAISNSAKSTRKVTPVMDAVEVGQDRRTLDPKQGFKNQGDFFIAVKNAANGKVDQRLTINNAGAMEKYGEDGGFLVPTDFRTEIQKKVQGDQSLLARTRQFKTSSNHLVLPTHEVAPWSTSGGIQAYWEGEAQEFLASKTKFGDLNMRLNKLTAMVRVTDELLEDAPALESFIKMEAPEVMLHKINSAIISGSGVGMPTGILNSGFKYKQAKVGGQAADTVLFENVNNMLGHILPQSLPNAVWLVNPAVLPQLRAMKFDVAASSPVPVYMPPAGVSSEPFGTLYGRPILPMMGGVKELGTEGDIILADLSMYYTALKTTGIKQDISTHVYFSTQETAFRFSFRMAGQVPYKSNVITENGNFEMSGIVTLEDR